MKIRCSVRVPALVTGRWRVSCVLTLMAQYFVFMLVFVFLDAFTFCFVLFFCFALLCFVLFYSLLSIVSLPSRSAKADARRAESSLVTSSGMEILFLLRGSRAPAAIIPVFFTGLQPLCLVKSGPFSVQHTHTHARTQGSQAQLVCNPPTSFYHRKRSFRFLAPSTNLNSRTGI